MISLKQNTKKKTSATKQSDIYTRNAITLDAHPKSTNTTQQNTKNKTTPQKTKYKHLQQTKKPKTETHHNNQKTKQQQIKRHKKQQRQRADTGQN
ncbi:hypothetical protein GCM10020220_072500 [Nonomuraea rubra]|uniref:hypothetical protein n=1 Tax=Nonomuraea rubra TaxID=46180 RepID=UPI0031EC1A42